jgi:hypothetical protein
MTTTSLSTRIRLTVFTAILATCLTAPAAFADPWGRDVARASKAQSSDVVDRYLANNPTRAHDERFLTDVTDRYVANNATRAHDERFLTDVVDRYAANTAARVHDERFAPIESSPLATSSGGSLNWLTAGGGAGAALLLAAGALMLARMRRIVHS